MQNRDPREDQASLQLAVAQDSCERGGGADVRGRSAAVQRTERDTEQVLVAYNDVDSATFLLNVVLARPRDVYQSFLTAVEKNNQMDAYLMLTDDGLYKY